jgi:phosphatidylinositol alpha 1,6-mannosyltransferase
LPPGGRKVAVSWAAVCYQPNNMNIRGMRIALFTGAYNHIADGVSLTLNRLVRYLEQNGAAVHVYAPTVANPAIEHAGTLVSVPSVSAPGRPEYRISVGLGKKARSDLTDFKPTLFHIATPDLLGVKALRVAAKSRTPVVATYHTHFASYLAYYHLGAFAGGVWRYLAWFYGHCAEVYVPTRSMIEVLQHNGIAGNLELWPRGVDSSLFNPCKRSTAWRHERGIADDEVVVAFVSRLVVEKGLDIVSAVLTGLDAKGLRYRALLVGDGPERQRLEQLHPNAIFAGHLGSEALATAYASADVFLFPSETETFGNVTLEAMSSGLPVVVANATGSSDLVEAGITGFLVEPRNAQDFLENTTRLVTDSEMRREMGNAARAVAERYEWKRILDKMADYYEAVTAG